MKVYFHPKMTAESRSYSPSASKPSKAVGDWISRGLPVHIREFYPASRAQLYRAHNRGYVDAVLECRQSNGFGNMDPEVAESLPYTSGAMLAAARDVIDEGGIACAPVSGFHHACWSHGGGFCTFNGLMVTALAMLDEGRAERVGIFDADMHYGNGTEDILYTLEDVDRFDIRSIVHDTVGRRTEHARSFLRNLRNRMDQFAGCDLLLYQAGADPHENDPLGGWMSTEDLAARDRIVFEWCIDNNVPCVWDLAGGYQRDADGGIEAVLEVHRNTARIACELLGDVVGGPVYSRTGYCSIWGSRRSARRVAGLLPAERDLIRNGGDVRISGCPEYLGYTERRVVAVGKRFYARLPVEI